MEALDQLTAAAIIESTIGTLDGLAENDDFTEEEKETLAEARDIIVKEYEGDE